jgi:hypothetical protein
MTLLLLVNTFSDHMLVAPPCIGASLCSVLLCIELLRMAVRCRQCNSSEAVLLVTPPAGMNHTEHAARFSALLFPGIMAYSNLDFCLFSPKLPSNVGWVLGAPTTRITCAGACLVTLRSKHSYAMSTQVYQTETTQHLHHAS